MRKLILMIFFSLYLSYFLNAESKATFDWKYGYLGSISTIRNEFSNIFNPAALGIDDDGDFAFYYTKNVGKGFSDWAFLSQIGSFGFTWENHYLNDTLTVTNNTYSYGVEVRKGIYYGLSLSRFRTESEYFKKGWNARMGFLYFPTNYLSLALTCDNLFNGRYLGTDERIYTLGASIKPLKIINKKYINKLEIYSDLTVYENKLDDFSWKMGFRSEIIDGLIFKAEYMDTHDYTIGLSLDILNIGFDVNSKYIDKNNKKATYLGVEVGSYWDDHFPTLGKKVKIIEISNQEIDDEENKDSKKMHVTSFIFSKNNAKYQNINDIISELEKFGNESLTENVFIEINDLSMTIQECERLRNTILDLKEHGKKVFIYLEKVNFGNYYIASIADEIIIHPRADFQILGSKQDGELFSILFKEKGLKFDIEKVNESVENRDNQLNSEQKKLIIELLKNNYKQYLFEIAQARNVSEEKVIEWLNKENIKPEEAFKEGIIDKIMNKNAAKERARKDKLLLKFDF